MILKAALMALTPALCAGATVHYFLNWKHGVINICEEDDMRLTGMCAAGRRHDCEGWDINGRDWKGWAAGKAKCMDVGAKVQGRKTWKLAGVNKWGSAINCDFRGGETAVGICTSGGRFDCKCTGSMMETNCPDDDNYVSHMLYCAAGLSIDPTDTVQAYKVEHGDDVVCPAGYVVYGMCSSGAHWSCLTELGKKVSHYINCVKYLTPDEVDLRRDMTKVGRADGSWMRLSTGPNQQKYITNTGVTSSDTETKEQLSSKSWGMSTEVSLHVSTEFGAPTGPKKEAGIQATQGFNWDWENSQTDIMSYALQNSEWKQFEFACGADSDGKRWTGWQWIWDSKSVGQTQGPQFWSTEYSCTTGNDIPLCVGGNCVNESCTVCRDHLCKIHWVSPDGAKFTIDKDCVDLVTKKQDWDSSGSLSSRGNILRSVFNIEWRRHKEYTDKPDWGKMEWGNTDPSKTSLTATEFQAYIYRRPYSKDAPGDAWGELSSVQTGGGPFAVGDFIQVTSFDKRFGCSESLSGNGEDYRGCQTETVDGRACQRWSDQTPNTHSMTPESKAAFGIGEHNYCRNPDGSEKIWCYVTTGGRWEWCKPLETSTWRSESDEMPAFFRTPLVFASAAALVLAAAALIGLFRKASTPAYDPLLAEVTA